MDKIISLDEAVGRLHDGATIMLGGFAGVGSPLLCIDKIVESGVKDLTILSEVSSMPGGGFDLDILFQHQQVKKIITSHIGTSPALLVEVRAGNVEVDLYPQGTWIEKVRAGGAGLGGILTPVGIGTLVEEGKQKLTIEGREYLLELPLRAEFAFIHGYRGDRMGNVEYRGMSINCNKVVATAADYVVAEVNEIVDVGDIDPSRVGTPGIFVDAVVQGRTFDEDKWYYNEHWDAIGALRHRESGDEGNE